MVGTIETKTCAICVTLFSRALRSPSQYRGSKREWQSQKYCSHKCANHATIEYRTKHRVMNPASAEFLRNLSFKRKGTHREPFNDEWRKKLSISHTGTPHPSRGNTRPSIQGANHWNWKGGVTDEKRRLKSSLGWKKWRTSVFERDDFTCQECKIRGTYIEPHHIIPLRQTLRRAFEINNGITLCRPCHLMTMGREEDFIAKYAMITSLSV